MPLRVGFVTAAHLHVWSYVHCLRGRSDVALVGVWDHDEARGRQFAERNGFTFFETRDELMDKCDAVAIVSENKRHAEDIEAAYVGGCHVICEKPIATTIDEIDQIRAALSTRSDLIAMTAFPCRYSPAFRKLKETVQSGKIGSLKALATTNRGRCPHGWFTQPELSGGGAMIDHTVHVADLLFDLLGAKATQVQAQTGSNMYGGKTWDDTAMLTIEYANGVFATLDSSWSRPATFRTWGDVTMTAVGDAGIVELDMFGQEVHHYTSQTPNHQVAGFGSNLDALMVEEWLAAIAERRTPLTSIEDGIRASKIAMAGYRSAATGQPAKVA